MPDKNSIAEYFRKLQDNICNALENEDGKARFREDVWEREAGGGGRTRVLENGNVFEKGGVNFSAVFGKLPEFLKKENNALPDNAEFFATGVSLVIHPVNPMVPIVHMNVRYFEISNGMGWFGGGIDLTPVYFNKEDVRGFHEILKKTCDRHKETYYPKFKKWADEYFFLPHRNETRGAGGIFFDRLTWKNEQEKNERFNFVIDIGETFVPAYIPIVQKNKNITYGERQKDWQLLRRSRYAEFNLLYDKGTKFGLETGGRTESILMSLPPLAAWKYHVLPEPGSPEQATLLLLKPGINWV